MSRFYSKHQITKTDRQLNEDNLLDTTKYKNDLRSAINNENHRVNVDSAKKKAVLQRMDYDGFHQMVLGADLKGIKSKEILNLKSNESIINNVMTQKKFTEEIDFNRGNFVVIDDNINKGNSIKLEEFPVEVNIKENYKNFKKNWKAKSKADEKISLLNELNDHKEFEIMIHSDTMEADIFLDFLFNLGLFCLSQEFLDFETTRKLFLLNCVKAIVDSHNFSGLKKFLGKKQKSLFKEINEKKKEIFIKEDILAVLDSFINMLI